MTGFPLDELKEYLESLKETDLEFAESLLKMLDERGEDALEEVIEAIQKKLLEELANLSTELEVLFDEEEEDDDDTEEEKDDISPIDSAIKTFLDKKSWYYEEHSTFDHTKYAIKLDVNGIPIIFRIIAYARRLNKYCALSATLPIQVDTAFEYPLCKLLAKNNLAYRFGHFSYNEITGRVSFKYSFLCGENSERIIEELDFYQKAVITIASDEYETIKKYSMGHFDSTEYNEILNEINELVVDLNN